MCLRQHTASSNFHIPELNKTKIEEWKLDVPTIGNIYRVAEGIVRYFNGLGRPFRTEGWDHNRHWRQRAWTLQEIKTENSTINGGIPRGLIGITTNMNTRMERQTTTLRHTLHPIFFFNNSLLVFRLF